MLLSRLQHQAPGRCCGVQIIRFRPSRTDEHDHAVQFSAPLLIAARDGKVALFPTALCRVRVGGLDHRLSPAGGCNTNTDMDMDTGTSTTSRIRVRTRR